MTYTVILGASDKPSRFSNKAQQALIDSHHPIILVNPKLKNIGNLPSLPSLKAIQEDNKADIETVTVYVRPNILKPMLRSLIDLKPKRVIFNPGTECGSCAEELRQHGIKVVEACTLVLLANGSY